MKKIRIPTRLTPYQKRALEKYSESTGMSESTILSVALTQFLRLDYPSDRVAFSASQDAQDDHA